ncbi:DgyrCDS624 [Dimorphilus gyrociliatus]|uniref:DgyrCDS624 n=1 Tax=Dimorphilus gyrociliatus TaxID=2664684 RepID=A0A7I8V6R4_9ANNE|nr:DgyrCDS624 [Dimorphilus gyrociliatus]
MLVKLFLICYCLKCSISEYPFRNISLSWAERVDDLVNRLTVDELIGQMSHGGGPSTGGPVPGIKRLGISPYSFATECIHGVMLRNATCFPQAIGLAATFSEDSVRNAAFVIATEARAIYNKFRKQGIYENYASISCFAPFINLVRHPLWGRIQEVYGEDPYLSGKIASAFVKGLHGDHKRYIKVSSGCKVVSAHSGPENIPQSRFSFDSKVSERDMRLTYLANVQACIEAGTFNLMCSYNSPVDAAADAVNAGVDLELSPDGHRSFFYNLTQAVKYGKVKVTALRESVKKLFYTRMRLGEFDPEYLNPYSKINTNVIQSKKHREVARKLAEQSFVLLKNLKETLPILKIINRLALIGPMVNDTGQLYGSYSPLIMQEYATTGMSLIALSKVAHIIKGCDDTRCKKYNSTAVKIAVSESDFSIVFLGTGVAVETEGMDRSNMDLPGHQEQLLKDVVSASKGNPVVVILFTGGPVKITWAMESKNVHAILQAWFPGQETGTALRRVLAHGGKFVTSPSGRLPYTWPRDLGQVPPMVDYSMKNRTYRYMMDKPLLEFGFGLSYTKFRYSNLSVYPTVVRNIGQKVKINFKVQNVGHYPSEEVPQVYIRWLDTKEEMPKLQLVAFKRTSAIKENRGLSLTFTIEGKQLAVWKDVGGFVLERGRIEIFVGGQQPSYLRLSNSNSLRHIITVA